MWANSPLLINDTVALLIAWNDRHSASFADDKVPIKLKIRLDCSL
jgi:hypothetical protein